MRCGSYRAVFRSSYLCHDKVLVAWRIVSLRLTDELKVVFLCGSVPKLEKIVEVCESITKSEALFKETLHCYSESVGSMVDSLEIPKQHGILGFLFILENSRVLSSVMSQTITCGSDAGGYLRRLTPGFCMDILLSFFESTSRTMKDGHSDSSTGKRSGCTDTYMLCQDVVLYALAREQNSLFVAFQASGELISSNTKRRAVA
eukprot:535330_1